MARSALTAGVAYFALAFGLGFLLGIVRVVMVAPRLGEVAAIAIELPIMLAASWVLCARVVARFRVPTAFGARVAMGGAAFALLMVAEFGVSALAFGRSPVEHLQRYGEPIALIGLAAQIAFAAFPAIQGAMRRGSDR